MYGVKKPDGPSSRYLILVLKLAIGFILLAILIALVYWYYQGEWREIFFRFKYFFSFRRLRDFILSFGAFSVVIFVILQALQVVFAPIPGEITGFVGGFLYGKVWGTILSTLGLTLGSILAFEITRIFGIALVRKVVKQEAMDHFDDFVTHRGLNIAFVLYLVPGFPKDTLCYLLGLTHVRRIDFLLMNVFGRLPGTFVLNFQGEAVRTGSYEAFFELLVGSILVTIVLYLARNPIIHSVHRITTILKKRLPH